jgi:hypothetical protein
MSIKRDFSLHDKMREIEDAMSMTVKLGHNQVLEVVVADLSVKYKASLKRNDTRYIEAFGTVLRFYLSEDEMEELHELIA